MSIGRWFSVLLLLAALTAAVWLGDSGVEQRPGWLAPVQRVTLYFAAPDAMGVAPETRWLPRGEADPAGRIRALIEGPRQPGLYPSVPATTSVLNVEQEGNALIADFDRRMVLDHPGGSAGEIITVYAVVNTLTEITGVQSVKFLIEGHSIESLAGHMDLRDLIERDETVIVTHPF